MMKEDLSVTLGVSGFVICHEIKSVKEITAEIRQIIDYYEAQGIYKLGEIPEGQDKEKLRELFKLLDMDVSF